MLTSIWELNLERQSKRQARRPLDHHGPNQTLFVQLSSKLRFLFVTC